MGEPTLVSRQDIEQKAKEVKEIRKLPPAPGEHVSHKELLEWINLLTPEMIGDESRIMIYMYRKDPVIIRQKADPTLDNNIDVFSGTKEALLSSLSEQAILNRHGGGSYKFLVKDMDKPKEQKGGYFEARLLLPININPPKLDLNEVDWDHKQNKGFKIWARTQRLIDENNMPVKLEEKKTGSESKDRSDAVVEAMRLGLDFAKGMSQHDQDNLKRSLGANDLSKSVGDILLEQMKQNDPTKQLQVITTLLSAMQQKGDGGVAAMMPMFMQMMTMMNEASNRNMTLMLEMFKSNQTPKSEDGEEPKSRVSELKELLSLAKEIKGGGSHSSDSWQGLVEEGMKLLQPALGIFQNMTGARLLEAQMKVGGSVNGTVTAAPPSASTQPNANVPTNVPALSNLERIQLENKQAMNQQPIVVDVNAATEIINKYGPLIIAKLASAGWEFAAWAQEGFGDEMVASIAKFGPDALLNAAKSVPQFWERVNGTYGEAHLRKWLTSFCNYKEEIEKMEMEG